MVKGFFSVEAFFILFCFDDQPANFFFDQKYNLLVHNEVVGVEIRTSDFRVTVFRVKLHLGLVKNLRLSFDFPF
jgi:hypothetical protein